MVKSSRGRVMYHVVRVVDGHVMYHAVRVVLNKVAFGFAMVM